MDMKSLADLDTNNAKEMVNITIDLMACGAAYHLSSMLERFDKALEFYKAAPDKYGDTSNFVKHLEVLKIVNKFLNEVRQTEIGKECTSIESAVFEMLEMTNLSS